MFTSQKLWRGFVSLMVVFLALSVMVSSEEVPAAVVEDDGLVHAPKFDRRASGALLKAPVHTCVIKYYKGLKQFVRETVKLYPTDSILVKAYSMPPHFILFDEERERLGELYVEKEWTEDDIVRVLNEVGITRPGDDELYQPGFPDAGSCEDEDDL